MARAVCSSVPLSLEAPFLRTFRLGSGLECHVSVELGHQFCWGGGGGLNPRRKIVFLGGWGRGEGGADPPEAKWVSLGGGGGVATMQRLPVEEGMVY
jgi:hypothetical protein